MKGANIRTSVRITFEEAVFGVDKEIELTQDEIKIEDSEIEPLDTKEVKKTVVPNPKNEGKKVMALFFKTMMAVAFSAIILYVILLFVKKYYGSAFVSQEENYEELDLSCPTNKNDALKSFLNRTK